MSSSLVGILSLFLAAFLYGSQNIASRVAGIDFGPFLATALRNIIVIFCLVWMVKWTKIKVKDWKWFILRAFGNIVATTSVFIAVNKMPVGMALFSFYASMMIFSAVIGFIFYKEKMTIIKTISLLITVIGLWLLNLSNTNVLINSNFLIAIMGGLGCSLWSIFSRPISSSYSLKQLVVVDNSISGIMALIISCLLQEQWHGVKLDLGLIGVLYLGITQVFTGQLVAKGFKSVEAQVGSVILLNDTVIGMILTFFIFHETTSLMVVAGGICIFLASIIPTLEARFNSSTPKSIKAVI